jgi:hypothetical protein
MAMPRGGKSQREERRGEMVTIRAWFDITAGEGEWNR